MRACTSTLRACTQPHLACCVQRAPNGTQRLLQERAELGCRARVSGLGRGREFSPGGRESVAADAKQTVSAPRRGVSELRPQRNALHAVTARLTPDAAGCDRRDVTRETELKSSSTRN